MGGMRKVRENLQWYVLGFLFLVTVLIWYAVVAEDKGGKLTVAFLNIGQGDAIFIESPTGVQLMIDGGPGSIVLRELGKVMPFYDRSIDMLMISNPDKDHMAGFLDVLDAYKVASVIEPGTVGASAEYKTLEEKIQKEKAVKITALRGQRIELGGGAYFEVLFPDRDVPGLATNDGSLVGRLVYGNTSVMFTGDAPQNIEGYLDSLDGKSLHSDVLKVGHHGSRTSTSQEFVGYVSPTYAVISAGTDNSYGHPHQETLDTLTQFGVQTLRTDMSGRIVMESDGETIWIKK
ncbi:MAG: Competence protein ComEC [Parcubacteria group bacterium GW2011_GWA2_49_9]|nr:MAG: Competence protein ComEC [Parcubacteria group bacterium GW2011_GWA2_49_9]